MFKTLIFTLSIIFLYSCEKRDETDNEPVETHEDLTINENLKQLEWLQGHWIDDEHEIDLQITFDWEINGSFLVQHFMVTNNEYTDLEGTQLIGWDPSQERIRSWIFDSDGGFGEGLWSQEEDTWYSNVSYVLPDGRKGSATQVYTKIDDSSYMYSSVNRDIDGTILPNAGPFKVIKE